MGRSPAHIDILIFASVHYLLGVTSTNDPLLCLTKLPSLAIFFVSVHLERLPSAARDHPTWLPKLVETFFQPDSADTGIMKGGLHDPSTTRTPKSGPS
jgi:hypothetical protein